jgi:hypothetical protein
MTEPGLLLEFIEEGASTLDGLSKDIARLTDEFLQAEAEWEVSYDEVADTLKDSMVKDGRASDPAEHTIVREARKVNREAWHSYRTAKKRLEARERQLRATTAAMSGRQSELKALTEEARMQGYSPKATQTFGRVAA